jgi:hypothetical protein
MEYARVYKLESSNGLVYYGSTTQKVLSQRLAKHKSEVNNTSKRCRSHLLFTEGDTVTITLVENVENCKDKYELQARERWYIENNDCVNKTIPNRTSKEWREENKESIMANAKEYYQLNREELLEKRKEYREANREKCNEVCREWHKKNREQQNKKQREYYEANKDKAKAWASEMIKCECGCEVARGGLPRHLKSQKHKNKMLELNKEDVVAADAGSVSPPSHICGEV